MKSVVRTWGNSLAIRIPKAFALHMGITPGKKVELALESNGMRMTPVGKDLDALLAQITPANLHGETETGSVVGNEVW